MSNLRILLSEGEHPPARPFLLQPPPAARLPARDPAASSAALRPTTGCPSPRHARRRVTWTGPAGRCSRAARPRMARLRPSSRLQAGSTRARRAGCPPRPNLARRGGASAPPRPMWLEVRARPSLRPLPLPPAPPCTPGVHASFPGPSRTRTPSSAASGPLPPACAVRTLRTARSRLGRRATPRVPPLRTAASPSLMSLRPRPCAGRGGASGAGGDVRAPNSTRTAASSSLPGPQFLRVVVA